MDHLPFEAMLFDIKQLTSEQRAELETHLASCAACSDLARALSQMEQHLAGAASVAPADGFIQRFQVRLQARRRRAIGGLLGTSVIAVLAGFATLAVVFGGDLLTALSPFVSGGLKSLVEFLRIGSLFGLLGEFLSLLVENIIGEISPAYLLAGSVAFSGMLALWLLSLYRMNTQSVRKE